MWMPTRVSMWKTFLPSHYRSERISSTSKAFSNKSNIFGKIETWTSAFSRPPIGRLYNFTLSPMGHMVDTTKSITTKKSNFFSALKSFLNCFKALINFTITGNSRILRTSSRFVQWTDLRTNIVYGLGFDEEEELCQVRQFKFTVFSNCSS